MWQKKQYLWSDIYPLFCTVTFSREKDGHVTFELLSVKFDFQVINLVA